MRICGACIVWIALFISCDSRVDPVPTLSGDFEGTFIRSSPNVRYAPANVELELEQGFFRGTSDMYGYPSVGNGTYHVHGNKIFFENRPIWTSEIDGSLILSGEFEFAYSGNQLHLTRTTGEITDSYLLILR